MEKKPKIVMVGSCPKCGKILVRPYPSDIAVCICENPPVEVPLESYVKIILQFKDRETMNRLLAKSKLPIVILPKRKRRKRE